METSFKLWLCICPGCFHLNLNRMNGSRCQFVILLNVTNGVFSPFPSNFLPKRSIKSHTRICCRHTCLARTALLPIDYMHAKKYLCVIINGCGRSLQESMLYNGLPIVYPKWLTLFMNFWFVDMFAHWMYFNPYWWCCPQNKHCLNVNHCIQLLLFDRSKGRLV